MISYECFAYLITYITYYVNIRINICEIDLFVMGRTSDTAERTLETAWQLLSQGHYPSTQAVRERIQQGSMTTINQTLQQQFWPAVAERIQMPEIPPPLAQLTQALWQQALESADECLAEHRHSINNQLAIVSNERDAALAEIKNLHQQNAVVGDRFAKLHIALSEVTSELEQYRLQTQQLQHQLALAQQSLAQAERAGAIAHEQYKEQLALERIRAADDEKRLTQLYDDQKTARERLEKAIDAQADRYQQQIKQLIADLNEREITMTLLNKDHMQLIKQFDAAKQQIQQQQTEYETLSKHYRGLTERHNKSLLTRARVEKENELLSKQNSALSQLIAKLPER